MGAAAMAGTAAQLLSSLIILATTAAAFNIDTGSAVVQAGPAATCTDCMFGFSVAQHKEGGEPW